MEQDTASIMNQMYPLFNPVGFDIGFVVNKGGSSFVVIVVNKRIDDGSGSPGVNGDLWVGDPDVEKFFKYLRSLARREPQINIKSPAKFCNMDDMTVKP